MKQDRLRRQFRFFSAFSSTSVGPTRSSGPNPLAYDPRGSGLSKEGYTASDVCGYAAHIAAGTERPHYQNKTSHRAYRAVNRTIILRAAFPAISSLEFLGRTLPRGRESPWEEALPVEHLGPQEHR